MPLKALSYGRVEQAAGGALRQKIALQQGIPIAMLRDKDPGIALQFVNYRST